MKDTTAVIVHYQTPDLTRAAIWSLRSQYPHLPIIVVDNGSAAEHHGHVIAAAKEAGGVRMLAPRENLHHGPGLHLGITRADSDWVLLFDSDCVAYRPGFIERMQETGGDDAYMVGPVCYVCERGFNVEASDPDAITYVHPQCALVRRAVYETLPPFELHGAPCLTNEREAIARGLQIREFDTAQYVLHIGRGTVSRFGYNLGIGGFIESVRRKIRL